jgi:hypothetical protein
MEPLPKPYVTVRVRTLLRAAEGYDGWQVSQRPPGVGDVGVLVEVLSAPGLPDHYVVECVASDGATVWLGEFTAEELELVDA